MKEGQAATQLLPDLTTSTSTLYMLDQLNSFSIKMYIVDFGVKASPIFQAVNGVEVMNTLIFKGQLKVS